MIKLRGCIGFKDRLKVAMELDYKTVVYAFGERLEINELWIFDVYYN